MGTRSLTVFEESGGQEIVVMYRQYDGYPSGYGLDLAGFLEGSIVVNRISRSEHVVHNGVGCLAASVVAHFKEGSGGVYLHAAGTRDCGEEYTYFVTGQVGSEPTIKVIENHYQRSDEILFTGTASEVKQWIESL